MENLIWYIVMVPCSTLFTGIGIYAWNRKKPMRFWSGTAVTEAEISDAAAYNHANGAMWILYSLIFWTSAIINHWNDYISLFLIIAGTVIGIPLLVATYKRIYAKYKI